MTTRQRPGKMTWPNNIVKTMVSRQKLTGLGIWAVVSVRIKFSLVSLKSCCDSENENNFILSLGECDRTTCQFYSFYPNSVSRMLCVVVPASRHCFTRHWNLSAALLQVQFYIEIGDNFFLWLKNENNAILDIIVLRNKEHLGRNQQQAVNNAYLWGGRVWGDYEGLWLSF